MKCILSFILIAFTFYYNAQVPTNGLVGHYPFTGNANDMSGNNYNGIVNGATLTIDRFGNPNYAYSFNGINNYIDLSSHIAAFNFQDPMTISFWVKTNFDNTGVTNNASTVFSLSEAGTGLNNVLIGVGNNSTGTLTDEIALTNHQISTTDKYIAAFTTSNRDTLIDDRWHHLIFEYNGVATKIYLDAILVSVSCNFGVNDGSYGNIPNATKMYIGTRWANSSLAAFMTGDLDDFRMYDRVLNTAEINSLYNEPNPFLSVSDINSEDDNIKIYPNPATDVFNIVWSNEINSKVTVQICDITGRILKTEFIPANIGYTTLDLAEYINGLYYIRFITRNFEKSFELIKQ